MIISNGNKSYVLIRDAQGVNALRLLMLVTIHHTKDMLNYEFFSSARIMHYFESSSDGVLKYSAPIFSSFLQCYVKFMQ